MNNPKKLRKTIEWERLEISPRKLEMPRKYIMQNGYNKEQKWYGPNKQKIIRGGKNTQKTYTKKILITQITMIL